MKQKTYNNVLNAGKLIQKKGYDKQESLVIALIEDGIVKYRDSEGATLEFVA